MGGSLLRGPLLDGIVVAVVLFVVLAATAHLWGPPLAWTCKRLMRNLDTAAAAFGRGMTRILGQGQTRPHGKRGEEGEKR